MAGLTWEECAQVLGRSVNTLYRWEAQNQEPQWAIDLVAAYSGFLFHYDFWGCEITPNGYLWLGHNRLSFNRSEIENIDFNYHRISTLQNVNQNLKKEVNHLTSRIDQLEQELAQAQGTPGPANSTRYDLEDPEILHRPGEAMRQRRKAGKG